MDLTTGPGRPHKGSWLWQVLLAACTASILYLSLIPAPPAVSTGWDKSNHALAMAVVTLLAHRSAHLKPWSLYFAFGYSLLLGAAIELLQGWCTTTRSAEWLDLVADLVGIAIMSILLRLYEKRTADRRMSSPPPA
ncbi:hypothetical protein SAMN02745119_00524 [Trichlorobacter thiogenes]|uniref:VanZ family protein n=2 Tax=Trichlorobacter thiogenes TaxID=115783 RepID=A0A1T4KF79_9BACT|nr:hypothetical protein SAMN02745119_00524 [Trichlorobacter thiogenes]